LGGQVMKTMELLKSFFFGGGADKENNVTVSIFYLFSNGNDVTITFCGNDAHL
jgi:hypothetical protein